MIRTAQMTWTQNKGRESHGASSAENPDAQLVLLFGGTQVLKDPKIMQTLQHAHPNAHLFGCSTSGEIFDTEVSDDTVVATSLHFDHTFLRGAKITVPEAGDS